MMIHLIIIVGVFLLLLSAQTTSHTLSRAKPPQKDNNYHFPNITVHVTQPQGVRFIVDDFNKGDDIFLRGEIACANCGSSRLEGHFRKLGLKWELNRPDLKLEIGDRISYSVLVTYDGLGFFKDKELFVVNEYQENNHFTPPHIPQDISQIQLPQPQYGENTKKESITEIVSALNELSRAIASYKDLIVTQQIILNDLQEKLVKSQQLTRKLQDVLEKQQYPKRLRITGNLPPGHPINVGRLILNEKLDIEDNVIDTAERFSDNCIVITTFTLEQKIRVLAAADRCLKYSKISITSDDV